MGTWLLKLKGKCSASALKLSGLIQGLALSITLHIKSIAHRTVLHPRDRAPQLGRPVDHHAEVRLRLSELGRTLPVILRHERRVPPVARLGAGGSDAGAAVPGIVRAV